MSNLIKDINNNWSPLSVKIHNNRFCELAQDENFKVLAKMVLVISTGDDEYQHLEIFTGEPEEKIMTILEGMLIRMKNGIKVTR